MVKRRLVTKVSIVNGQEVREVIEDQVVQNPVSQVIAVGTKKEVQPAPTPTPQAEPTYQVAKTKGTQEEGKEGQASNTTWIARGSSWSKRFKRKAKKDKP